MNSISLLKANRVDTSTLPQRPCASLANADTLGRSCVRALLHGRRTARLYGIHPEIMDFSAWFEAYLEDRWWTFDARHNQPRIGRVLMAVGRDASDVAITPSFGTANLKRFTVTTHEVLDQAGSASQRETQAEPRPPFPKSLFSPTRQPMSQPSIRPPPKMFPAPISPAFPQGSYPFGRPPLRPASHARPSR